MKYLDWQIFYSA